MLPPHLTKQISDTTAVSELAAAVVRFAPILIVSGKLLNLEETGDTSDGGYMVCKFGYGHVSA